MGHPPLSEGFLERVLKSDSSEIDERPVLQVIGTKPLNNGERFRLLISDGRHCNPFVMLATQLNSLVKDDKLNRHAIIRVNKHICNSMSSKGEGGNSQRRILIILDLEVLKDGKDVGPIGKPQTMNQDGTTGAPASSSSAPSSGAVNGHGAVKRPPSPAMPSEQPRPKAPAAAAAAAPPSSYAARNGPSHSHQSNLPSDINPEAVVPIAMLTPYSNNWCLRARVTQKADVRTYSNARGDGKLFSMTLADESGEIRATFFNQDVDRIFDIITTGNVYYFKGGRLKAANKMYTSVKNEYEITGGYDTQVVPCDDDAPDIPKTKFSFVKIKDIAGQAPESVIDVIGVVKRATDATTFTAQKSQKELTKRELVLVDDSKSEINMTLWGDTAVKFDPTDQPVLAVKGAKVSDFGGRSLSALQSSVLMVNPPDLREAHVLRGWFDDGGKDESATTLSVGRGGSGGGGPAGEQSSIALTKMPVSGDETKYTSIVGTIVAFRETNALYKSCGIDDCKKKVLDQNDGTYRCPKCDRPNQTSFVYRYTLSAFIRDATEGLWVTFFDEQAKEILGVEANELGNLLAEDQARGHRYFQEGLFKAYNFRLRSKMESYNDDLRLKTQCIGISSLSAQELVELIEREIPRMCEKNSFDEP